jgi:hypothetical protein
MIGGTKMERVEENNKKLSQEEFEKLFGEVNGKKLTKGGYNIGAFMKYTYEERCLYRIRTNNFGCYLFME